MQSTNAMRHFYGGLLLTPFGAGVPEPTLQDNLPDITRLISFLNLEHDEHRLEVDLSVFRKISEVLRQDDLASSGDCEGRVHLAPESQKARNLPGSE